MLSSFKKQLEDAGYFVAQAREAQKAAEMEAAKCREDAHVAADAKQKAEEDLRKVAQLKCQAEERAANEREAVQKEMDNTMVKAMKDVEARRKALEERTRIAEEALRMASTSDEDEMMVESQPNMTCKVSHLMPSKGGRGPLSHINSLWLIAFSIVLSTRLIAYLGSHREEKPQPWGKCAS